MTDSWLPPAKTVLRGVLGGIGSVVLAVTAWLLMDWLEGRMLLAQTVHTLQRVEAQAQANEHAIEDREEHDHKVDLAIQRLTDMLAVHDEIVHELRDDHRRRR